MNRIHRIVHIILITDESDRVLFFLFTVEDQAVNRIQRIVHILMITDESDRAIIFFLFTVEDQAVPTCSSIVVVGVNSIIITGQP